MSSPPASSSCAAARASSIRPWCAAMTAPGRDPVGITSPSWALISCDSVAYRPASSQLPALHSSSASHQADRGLAVRVVARLVRIDELAKQLDARARARTTHTSCRTRPSVGPLSNGHSGSDRSSATASSISARWSPCPALNRQSPCTASARQWISTSCACDGSPNRQLRVNVALLGALTPGHRRWRDVCGSSR